MITISITELKSLLLNESIQLIDIREKYECEESSIEGAIHIPMADIPNQIQQLDPTKKTVIFCNSGRRSEPVVNLLHKEFSFQSIYSLAGGISAWLSDQNQ